MHKTKKNGEKEEQRKKTKIFGHTQKNACLFVRYKKKLGRFDLESEKTPQIQVEIPTTLMISTDF